MAHLIVIILIILSGGILFSDQQITRTDTSLLSTQSLVQEVKLSSIKQDSNSQSAASIVHIPAQTHFQALLTAAALNNLSFNMARVLETSYLTPEKDIRISLALRGPPLA